MATTNDLKNGMALNLDGQLWSVVEFQHVKPGKGGAFVRTKLKNIMSGKVVDRTFNAGVKVDVANVDRREMQYLYREGPDFVFMDTQDYDQPRVPASVVGDAANYLLEEQTVTVAFNDGTPLYVDLPAAVELTISQTDPGVQGDRSTGGTKRPPWRPAQPSRCRCSSRLARRSRSTRGPASTSAAPDERCAFPAGAPPARSRRPRVARRASGPWTSCSRPSSATSQSWSCLPSASRWAARQCPTTPRTWSAASPCTRRGSTR